MIKHFFTYIMLLSFYAQAQEVTFKRIIEKDSIHLNLINHLYAPVETTIITKDSLKEQIITKPYFIAPANDTVYKMASIPIRVIKDTSDIKVTDYFEIDLKMGDPDNTLHDDDYLYALPYPKGKKYRIIQGFKGRFSHSSIRSKYAIDFSLQIGDTITAARDGVVVRIRDEFKERGGRSFIDKANLITIIHDDGTIAAYVHLDYKGIFVKPGDYVERGQPLGISGFTGFTTTPHLHFVVRKARNVAIPIFFESYKGKVLKKGKHYQRVK